MATVEPPHDIVQTELAERAARYFSSNEGGYQWLLPIYRNAEIRRRHSVVAMDWFLQPHSFSERNSLFLEKATGLLTELAAKTLSQAGLQAQDIDTIVTVCSSGVATPALDARVMQHLPFRPETQRVPLFGLGCAGGVLGLSRAAAMARAAPNSRVLFLDIELSTLTFRRDDRSKANLVATALFGDGAAGAVLTCRDDAPASAPRIGPAGEHTWPDTLDIMGWSVDPQGFGVIFDRAIPPFAEAHMEPAISGILKRGGLTLADIDRLAFHPGGKKVVTALEKAFSLEQGTLNHERDILAEYGNMSAPTALFVLDRLIQDGLPPRTLLTAMGPGFTTSCVSLTNAA